MIITVQNIALDKYLEKLGVNSLNKLTDEQLLKLCKEMGVAEIWIMDKDVAGRRKGLDRVKVIDNINLSVTYDDYMGTKDWDPEHDLLDTSYQIRESLITHELGGQTFKTMESAQMGFYRLKPGETRTLNVSQRWLDETFLKAPTTQGIKAANGKPGQEPKVLVKDEEGNILNKDLEPVEEKKKEVTGVDYDKLDWPAIKAMAKGKGINVVGKKKEILVEMIQDKIKSEALTL